MDEQLTENQLKFRFFVREYVYDFYTAGVGNPEHVKLWEQWFPFLQDDE